MPGRLTIHDTRLEGDLAPNNETGQVIRVNESIGLAEIFSRIVAFASQQNGLDVLFIIAHGVENLTVQGRDGREFHSIGGAGVMRLGRESLGRNNIGLVKVLKKVNISKIVLISCKIADNTDARLRNTRFDGMLFCKDFSEQSGKTVIASSSVQIHGFSDRPLILQATQIDWRSLVDLEPPVYVFTPDRSVRTMTESLSTLV